MKEEILWPGWRNYITRKIPQNIPEMGAAGLIMGALGGLISAGFHHALLPCFLAAFVASRVSLCFGVHAEGIVLETALGMDILTLSNVEVLAVAISVLGIAMCTFFHKAEHFAHHHIPNPFVRIAVGGVIVMVLTLLVGDHRFNGAGMDMALKAVEGETDWYNFLLKMLFTAVTLAAGFKGGEIVPTFLRRCHLRLPAGGHPGP